MRRSRFRGRRRRPLVVLSAAVTVLAALVLAALSSTANDPHRVPRVPSGTTTSGPPRRTSPPAPARRRLLRLPQSELRAIDATLRYAPVITSGSAHRREVALTFDDGPSQFTSAILAVLRRKHVPATFFVVGQQLKRFPRRLHDELGAGLPIGDHTESHAWLARLDPRGQSGEIDGGALSIRQQGGEFPRLFRPPYGSFNTATLRMLRRRRMLLVLWSVDPGDWRRPGVGAIVANVLHNSRPGGIVLMHDGGGYRAQTVAALPSIIDGLRRRHYALVTVPRLILDDPPSRHTRLPRFTGA